MATLTVGLGGTYSTIQAAVDAAGNGDTIEIAAGTYREQVTVDGKSGGVATFIAGYDASNESDVDPRGRARAAEDPALDAANMALARHRAHLADPLQT